MQPSYERRDERFGLVLNAQEKAVLMALAEKERISAANVLRRLVWQAGQAAQIPAVVGPDNAS
jgi:hypothetical protein